MTVECGICFEMADNFESCPHCLNEFCMKCMMSWFEAKSSHAVSAPCPMCRRQVQRFKVSSHVPKDNADSRQIKCPVGCGQTVTRVNLSHHIKLECAESMVACPYENCNSLLKRNVIDEHTFHCPFRGQYAEALYARECQQSSTSDSAGTGSRANSGSHPVHSTGDTVIHYVKENDTLAGIAVKYGTTRQEIKRLNRMQNDSVFCHFSLLVPSNLTNLQPDAPPSNEVLEALRKRGIIKKFIAQTRGEVCEAISYLSFCDFDLEIALTKYREDNDWLTTCSQKTQPRDLSTFIETLERKRENFKCGNCKNDLGDRRSHCASCGFIFCSKCPCSKFVAKCALGATAPTSAHDTVQVCDLCFNELSNRSRAHSVERSQNVSSSTSMTSPVF